ncbi:GDSL-type esterase/lipase family protein [Microbacterium testaceum]|uniref:golvesin C-terminal-like domain-containing protein n=1 Tax=Microbacterium testaceum TaxID=2033 RepID=UPI0019D3BC87|nr:GDSL-type esterase/lipase family protein [Microbacterium testaceum]
MLVAPAGAVATVRDVSAQTTTNTPSSTEPSSETLVESEVPLEQRDQLLGDDWETSDDVAWTLAGDSSGLRVLRAEARKGYAWHEVSILFRPGYETDRWIGNACLASDRRTLAVVYAPRHFTNEPASASRGGFGALVDLASGEVKQLGEGYTLAYFSPSCGLDDWVTFTQYADDGRSRLVSLRGSESDSPSVLESNLQLTSAVRTDAGVYAATDGAVVKVLDDGALTIAAKSTGNAYQLAPTPAGDLAYVDHDGDQASVKVVSLESEQKEVVEVAKGPVDDLGLVADSSGQIFITGVPDETSGVDDFGLRLAPGTTPDATMSSNGDLAIASTMGRNDGDGSSATIALEAKSIVTSEDLSFAVAPEFPEPAPAESTAATLSMSPLNQTMSASSPVSSGSPCAVPRNDPAQQAMQPRPAQVEWAVNQAIKGALLSDRDMGSGSYKPQTMFPRTTLVGGGEVPAPILLGILAQESNLWQASIYSVPGVSGNPLIGNYYGVDKASSSPNGWWQIDYDDADCGYGIGQVTDLMRSGEMPYKQQQAIALDYQANIARSLQILAEKWNQTRSAGLTINNGASKYPENWFYALWAYNTGFYPQGAAGQPWGVGWFNNPVNPIYPPYRSPFMQVSPSDAANPQNWPYPEKVLGFAAHSVQLTDSVSQGGSPRTDTYNYVPAFQPAWWLANDNNEGFTNRANVKPPTALFCDTTNQCTPGASIDPDGPGGEPAGPCAHKDAAGKYDLKCFFHKPATWKPSCSDECGYQQIVYAAGVPEPANATSYPPNCSISPLPSTALIIDNLPSMTASKRSCSVQPSAGSFEFTFGNNPQNQFPSKVDLHQLGSGFNGQFYFSHTRVRGTSNHALIGGVLDISGKWTLSNTLNGWATVMVHMPSHAAWAQQAVYEVYTGTKTVKRSISQRNYGNEWVSLGAMQFSGKPSVTLSNATGTYAKGDGQEDIAWDAVAFVPQDKPTEFVVSLGDSYSSGEGTSATNGAGFTRSSDNNGTSAVMRNACHRSPEAWPYKIDLPSVAGTATIRDLSQLSNPVVDYHMLACSGAVTDNVKPGNSSNPLADKTQYGEDNQLDRGFIDENTTLVTISIGGNDLGFPYIVEHCIAIGGCALSDAPLVDGEVMPNGKPSNTYKTKDWIQNRLDQIPSKIQSTLLSIKAKGPSARVVMLGYPSIFESGSSCVGIPPDNLDWLNEVTTKLNQKISAGVSAAQAQGVQVTYLSPQHEFKGRNLCTSNSAINGLILEGTPGDVPLQTLPWPGTDIMITASAQSVHPNLAGAGLYAKAANTALRLARNQLSSTLVGGASTTYYSTLRYHAGGPASMNVKSFSSCGSEIRFGLRRGAAAGTQDTATLSWKTAYDVQVFYGNDGSANLPAGEYALNGRLVSACSGGAAQAWSADLFLRAQ